MTNELAIVPGGCAVNAAIAIARLGGNARYAGPLGGADDSVSETILKALQDEGVETSGVVRVTHATAPVSGIMVDATGERMIVTYRDPRIESARLPDPDSLLDGVDFVLADNRFPAFVRPLCERAHARRLPLLLDADRPTRPDDPLFALATHIVFSTECLRATTGIDDLASALKSLTKSLAFVAVSNGPDEVRYLDGDTVRAMPVFKIEAVDTLAAGDVFHAGTALGLAEGLDSITAMRFGAAAAALKCRKFGGSLGAPRRDEVESFLRAA